MENIHIGKETVYNSTKITEVNCTRMIFVTNVADVCCKGFRGRGAKQKHEPSPLQAKRAEKFEDVGMNCGNFIQVSLYEACRSGVMRPLGFEAAGKFTPSAFPPRRFCLWMLYIKQIINILPPLILALNPLRPFAKSDVNLIVSVDPVEMKALPVLAPDNLPNNWSVFLAPSLISTKSLIGSVSKSINITLMTFPGSVVIFHVHCILVG